MPAFLKKRKITQRSINQSINPSSSEALYKVSEKEDLEVAFHQFHSYQSEYVVFVPIHDGVEYCIINT